MENKSRLQFSTTLDALLVNLSRTGRGSKQAVTIFVDSTLVLFSLWLAYSLRLGTIFTDFASTWYLFLIMPMATVILFMALGIYRWVVRSSNLKLFKQLLKACILASLFLVLLAYLAPPESLLPRSLVFIFGLLLAISTCGARFVWQGLFDSGNQGEPVAIYGAGETGRQLVVSLSQGADFRPVLFIDDSLYLADTMVSGLPVISASSTEFKNYLTSFEVERVILAMPTISASQYEAKVKLIQDTGVLVQTIATRAELFSGSASLEQIRDISMSDILGRTEVLPDPQIIGRCVSNQVVMVTGGGGSIGSELCRQILAQNPTKLIVLDHAEENLYKITEELRSIVDSKKYSQDIFIPMLCSVNDADRIHQLMEQHSVNTVFHAAAYKHVPIIQAQPEQGVNVNIFGTLNVLEASIAQKVSNFVLISTDKAVRPTNSMGASKRVAELVLQAKSRMQNETKISMVRFGNVLGSSGSVVPKFKRQIEVGGPITLTDPNITRYFMTIPEAAQLVLQAGAIAQGGDVFVLDMGDPVRIEDLAVSMVRMSGKRLVRDTGNPEDIEILVEGLRPGEKMYEELFINNSHRPTVVSKIFTADEHWVEWEKLKIKLAQLEVECKRCDRTKLRALLLDLAFQSPITDDMKALESTSKVINISKDKDIALEV